MMRSSSRVQSLALPPAILLLAITLSFTLIGCPSSNGPGQQISGDPQQSELPGVEVKLPPRPSFEKEHAPASYADGSLSVHGLRKDMKAHLDKQANVTGFVVEIYECPPCPKGTECKPCQQPHLWLGDRSDSTKDSALLVVDFPARALKTRGPSKLKVGAQYRLTGLFSKSSPSGFSSSEGLLVYAEHSPAAAAK